MIEKRKIACRRITEARRHGFDGRARFVPHQQPQVARSVEPRGDFAPLKRPQRLSGTASRTRVHAVQLQRRQGPQGPALGLGLLRALHRRPKLGERICFLEHRL